MQCRFNPGAPAICAPGTELNIVSYGKLERFIHNVARKGAALGLAQGQVVAIFVADKIPHAALVLGLTRLGIVTLSGRNSAVPAGVKVDAVIADQRYPFLSNLSIIPAGMDWLDGTAADDIP